MQARQTNKNKQVVKVSMKQEQGFIDKAKTQVKPNTKRR